MKFLKKLGGVLCFLGCVAAITGILATAAPMINIEQLQNSLRSLAKPGDTWFTTALNATGSFCLSQNYLVFGGGIILLVLGGVIRSLADRALFNAHSSAPMTETKRKVERDASSVPQENTKDITDAPSITAHRIENEPQVPAHRVQTGNETSTVEDFRPQIVVNPAVTDQTDLLYAPRNTEKIHDTTDEQVPAGEAAVGGASLANTENEAPETQPMPLVEQVEAEKSARVAENVPVHPEWGYFTPVNAAMTEDIKGETTVHPDAASVSEWETCENTEERVIVVKRGDRVAEDNAQPIEARETPQRDEIPRPAEPTPLEQSATNRHRYFANKEQEPAPQLAAPVVYHVLQSAGKPKIVTTMPGLQFSFETPAEENPAPVHRDHNSDAENPQTLSPVEDRPAIINTMGRRSDR